MSKFSLAATFAVATALLAAPAGAVTILNGSFEAASLDPGVFTTLGAGSTAITGWTVGGDSIDYIDSYWQAADGARSIDLSGNNKGSMGWTEQVFNFTAAATTANLTFSAPLSDAYGPALDNVSISGGVGGLMRRRRAITA